MSYTWVPFYTEMAQRLASYRDRQPELVAMLKAAGIASGLTDQHPAGQEQPLTEIDPFTFFSMINKFGEEKRLPILSHLKQALSLSADLPTDFDGVPSSFSQNAWFFPYRFNRQGDQISTLWTLFEEALTGKVSSDAFRKALTIPWNGEVKVTHGLFWVNPNAFLPINKYTKPTIEAMGIDPSFTDAAEYQSVVQAVRARIGTGFPQFSHEAFLTSQGSQQKQTDTTAMGTAAQQTGSYTMAKKPLNQILYGPPGTGKTFATKRLAVEICDGVSPEDRAEVLERFEALRAVNRIEFVTFHQSFAYEDFVEGLRPVLDVASVGDKAASVQYECRPGVFRRICSAARGATETTGQKTQGIDLADRRVFKMSLGDTQLPSEAYIYNECIEKGYVLLGYGEGLDFTGCKSRADVMERLKQVKPDIASNDYNISSVAYLMFEVKKGDLILVSDGNTQFRAIGEVTGDYEWVKREDTFSQKLAVRWLRVFDESQPIDLIFGKRLSQMTLYLLDQQSIKREALQALLAPTAQASTPPKHVLIIDEINRANISKVFGELITLLEPDKRLGGDEEIRVRLPYSHQEFGVPGNLHVIGTMNSADHSIALLDTALRRRFVFKELRSEPSLLEGADEQGMIYDEEGDQIDLRRLLQALNQRIEFLRGRDQQIGHAYLMGVKDLAGLQDVFRNQIIPLLQEHFYEDWAGMARVLAVPPKVSPFVVAKRTQASDLFGQIEDDYGQFRDEATLYSLASDLTGDMFRGLYAHLKAGD